MYGYIYIYIYMNTEFSINENSLLFQKDADRFTDFLASPEMSVRVDFEG